MTTIRLQLLLDEDTQAKLEELALDDGIKLGPEVRMLIRREHGRRFGARIVSTLPHPADAEVVPLVYEMKGE